MNKIEWNLSCPECVSGIPGHCIHTHSEYIQRGWNVTSLYLTLCLCCCLSNQRVLDGNSNTRMQERMCENLRFFHVAEKQKFANDTSRNILRQINYEL